MRRRHLPLALPAILLLLLLPGLALADYLEVRRPAYLKQRPQRDAPAARSLSEGELLLLLREGQSDGYYYAQAADGGLRGWVYRTLVRRHAGLLPDGAVSVPVLATPAGEEPVAPGGQPIRICSFNIKWLGHLTRRDDQALVSLLDGFDVVLVQELVCPPVAGWYPDGEPFDADPQAADFFGRMADLGYASWLSEEDTGNRHHEVGPISEWWVAFYAPDRLAPADDLPRGFIADQLADNPVFSRVPYAFGFRSLDGTCDFVLVSVHLAPGHAQADAETRRGELAAIAAWVDQQDGPEGDYLIVGDMNIEDADELAQALPAGFAALNDECRPTNTNPDGPFPYDHVLYRPQFSGREVDAGFDFQVVDLVEAMREPWADGHLDPYPGDPYDDNLFAQYYSDHDPVLFRLVAGGEGGDDD